MIFARPFSIARRCLSFKSPPMDPAVTHVSPQRHVLQLLFADAMNVEDVEVVLAQALEEIRAAYHPEDCAEPLLMAFEAYTRIVPLGREHCAMCLGAMEAWEAITMKRVSREVYHRLLTIYGGNPREIGIDYSNEVMAIVNRMRDRQVQHDDWTIFLCSKVLCNSGYADW